jgi:hypothetical protein
MRAIEIAKMDYERNNLLFEQDLGYYLMNGYVFSTPDRFLMAKPVRKSFGEKDWHPDNPDAWYVHYASGKKSLQWFIEQAPFYLPFIAWKRSKSVDTESERFYPTSRLFKILKNK